MTNTMKTILDRHTIFQDRTTAPAEPWRSWRYVDLKKILVPVDFTTATLKALQYARPLAVRFRSTVCLLHVVERDSSMSGEETVLLWKSDPETTREAQVEMESLARRYLGPSTPVEIQVAHGWPPLEILRAAPPADSGLIILTTHGLHGWRHLFRGSTAQAMLRDSPCPVLLLQCPKPAELAWETDADALDERNDNETLRPAA